MPYRCAFFALIVALLLAAEPRQSTLIAQHPVFRASAERVTVAVVARDRNGRPIRGLSAADFHVSDDGQFREILDFRNDLSPISVALLVDTSGSMHGIKLKRASDVGHFLLASMSEGTDEAALFVFDKAVRTVQPFTSEFDRVLSSFPSIGSWGSTSLYDAIAETAQQLAKRPGRRAIIVLTDGVDTSSQHTAQQVSGIASAIDMPVYVVAVETPVTESGDLTNLARWSGGMLYGVSSTTDGSVVARQIVTELRHQYLLAFEPSSSVGWHRIEVRSLQRATLQARSGYWVGPATLNR
jgi:Ca-activated chloride channel homolog